MSNIQRATRLFLLPVFPPHGNEFVLFYLSQQGSLFYLDTKYPQPLAFSFWQCEWLCLCLHPPFSRHAVVLYPWQPMISFSPELGGRPPARRGVFAFVCDF
ncbi:hypothetical protein ILYODFUR_003589 [Ilyodon furcidens]|uniref:Uncharacterized protein n=1 Tax=Ilyodon furcidens TaxID=33524 RepID=A0ABV0TFQ6_9TELE